MIFTVIKSQESWVKEKYPANNYIQDKDEPTKPGRLQSVHTSFQGTKVRNLISYYDLDLLQGSQYKPRRPYKHTEITRQTKQTQISSLPHKNSFLLFYQKEIQVHSDIDAYKTIYACAILSHKRLVIADDKGLSVVNIQKGHVEQKTTLKTWRSDIAVLPNDQVAVTLPTDGNILIFSTPDMSLIRSIPTENFPFGITYHQDELYVVYNPNDKRLRVNILNMQGNLLRKFECDECDEQFFSSLNINIVVSADAQNLYILNSRSLIRYSAQGQKIASYHLMGKEPKEVTLLDDSSLLVISDTIHRISADLNQGYTLKLDEENVRFICVDPLTNHIYVIYEEEVQRLHKQVSINVYYMQKQDSRSDKKLKSGTADKKSSSLIAEMQLLQKQDWRSEKKLISGKADKNLSSLIAGMKLPSLQTDEKLSSLKAVMMRPSLQTDEKVISFQAGMTLPSIESDEELDSLKAGMTLISLETDEKVTSCKAEKNIPSLEADEK